MHTCVYVYTLIDICIYQYSIPYKDIYKDILGYRVAKSHRMP